MTHLKCEVHADVSHNELVLVQLDGQMEKGEVEARGGVIAGSILMQNLEAHGEVGRGGRASRFSRLTDCLLQVHDCSIRFYW